MGEKMSDALKNTGQYFPEIPMGLEPRVGILTKESNNKNAIRTKSIEGRFNALPVEEVEFSIWGKSLSKDMEVRLVITSPVEELLINVDGTVVFKTESGSQYRLDYTTREEG